MWIRKTQEEIRKEWSIRFKWTFMVNFILFFFGTILIDMFGFNRGAYFQYEGVSHSWAEINTNLPLYLLVGLLGALICGFKDEFRMFRGFVCMSCSKVKENGDGELCKCGGQFEDMSKLKWIEE